MGRIFLRHREIFILNEKHSWAKGKLVLHLYLAQLTHTYELPEGKKSPFMCQLCLYILSMCMNLWLYEQPYPVIEYLMIQSAQGLLIPSHSLLKFCTTILLAFSLP